MTWAFSFVVLIASALSIAITRRTSADVVQAPRATNDLAAASANPVVSGAAHGESASYGVVLQFTDALDDAVVDVPSLPRVKTMLEGYWRRMRDPHGQRRGALADAVQQIGFQTGNVRRSYEPFPRPNPIAAGGVTQRDAIIAPPPASIRHRLLVPAGARFEAEVAVFSITAEVAFEVVIGFEGRRTVVGRRVVHSQEMGKWWPLDSDLSAYAGRSVEIELVTRSEQRTPFSPLSLWGAPVVLAPGAAKAPYNVLWITVDALRADSIASFHDDERDRKMASARQPPLDAWLPKLPEVAPNIDKLAATSAIFTRAWSAGTWTRPGSIAMLSGMRNVDVGLTSDDWVVNELSARRFYALKPPLLPLVLKRAGYQSHAFVNNFFLLGYTGLGVDLGFDGLEDFRDEIGDTDSIRRGAIAWLDRHAGDRFALYLHLNSPHAPYVPPKRVLDAIPKPPRGPKDEMVRRYLGEVHKDDAAIAAILAELERLKLDRDTIVVITADHGETLSEAHNRGIVLDGHIQTMRFRHAPAIWEETVRIPILIRLPGRIRGLRVTEPVSNLDLWPTLIDLLGLERDPRIRGRSLVPLLDGGRVASAPMICEGRLARAILVGDKRYVERDPRSHIGVLKNGQFVRDELYDLATDPGERSNVITDNLELAHELKRQLDQVIEAARHAGRGTEPSANSGSAPKLHVRLRFAGAGAGHHVKGTLRAIGGTSYSKPASAALALPMRTVAAAVPAPLVARPAGIAPDAVHLDSTIADFDFTTDRERAVGVDVELDSSAALSWALEVDGRPLSPEDVHVGELGVVAPNAASGLSDASVLAAAMARAEPWIDAQADFGLFVTLDAADAPAALQGSEEAHSEAMQLLRDWGYVAGPKP